MRKTVWRLLVWCLLVFKLTNSQTNKLSYAEINNTLAYSVSHTSSTGSNDLNVIGTKTICQSIYDTSAGETWYGIVIYLDRQGLSSSTDSVRLRFRAKAMSGLCGTSQPDTGGPSESKRDVYVKVSDIPDGDGVNGNVPPDSIGRGYAIWFIFDTPVTTGGDECYYIFLNAPKVDNNNRICWNSGSNGYADGTCWYALTNEGSGGWTNYNYDLNFRVIKDKYALVALRRYPFNLKGVLTINSDIDKSSVVYLDSLHRWLNTSQNVGGSWGQGLNGKIADNDLWFGRASTADSLGTFSSPIPYYFHGLDTTSNYYKDTVDNYISRRWADGNHAYVSCDGTSNCADSTNANKWLNYMLNRPSAFGKMYTGGIWINHGTSGQNTINFGNPGDAGLLGDSSGTVYWHSHRTLASGRFKFVWIGDLFDPGNSSRQFIPYINWQGNQDSLNFNALPFNKKTLRDNNKTYVWYRVGRFQAAYPESTYKFFNLNVARQCVDSLWASVHYTHFGYNSGLTSTCKDSIRAVHDSASSWKLWIPSTKAFLNQQAASAFAQITVDRPSGSKRRINIRSLYDWSWGSHLPDREEVYYLTFTCYAPESLIIAINGTDTLTDSVMTSQQEVPTEYRPAGATQRQPMSWVSMYDRTAGRKTVVYTPPSAPSGKRNRTAVIEQLLSSKRQTENSEQGEKKDEEGQ